MFVRVRREQCRVVRAYISVADAAECTRRRGQGARGSRCGSGWVGASSGQTRLRVDATRGAQGGVGCHGHDTLPLSRSLLSHLPPSTLYPSSPYHTLSYSYTSCPYLYNYIQTTPFRSLSLVPLSISSLCTLCIPQPEYHLRYSSLWSDPVHVPSLTCPQLAHL